MVGGPGHRDHLAGHDLVRVDSVEAGHALHAPEGADTDLEQYRTMADKLYRRNFMVGGAEVGKKIDEKSQNRASADNAMER